MLQSLILRAESEKEVNGSLLLSTEQLDEVCLILEPKHFLSEQQRLIFETITTLHRDGKETSADVVFRHCDQTIITPNDLHEAMESVINSHSVVEHACGVVNAWKCREFAKHISFVAESCNVGIARIDDAITEAASKLESLVANQTANSRRTFKEIVVELASSGTPVGTSTGIQSLDRMLNGGGWLPGQFVVIGARPGVGKTGLMTGLALAAERNGVRTTYLSFEMRDREIADRLVRQSGLNLCDEIDLERAAEFQFDLRDSSGWTIEKIVSAIRQVARKEDRKIVFVDYIGLIQSSNRKRERWQEIGDITRELKCLSQSLQITIIAAQQFSRAVANRASSRPLMSDFRESGNIEQDADILLGIERETFQGDNAERNSDDAILHVMKQRNGVTCEIPLTFHAERTLFKDRDQPSWSGDIPTFD
jgi:replicative DNA helicase